MNAQTTMATTFVLASARGAASREPFASRKALGGLCLAAVAFLLPSAPASDEPEAPVSFAREIRPILSDKCFHCHGPDAETRKARLRLDERDAALALLAPGDADASEVVARVASSDPLEAMPPPSEKKALTPTEVALLRRWIEQGAPYEAHWAFLPVSRPEPPAIPSEAAERVKNSIDQFVFSELNKIAISPSQEAEPTVLLRRLHLDLTGLLPSPNRVESFIEGYQADPDAAVAAEVDALLASPHYGERWGRHWLDQARYADSNGYSIDGDRTMWPYRDWVIRAINDDLPFDRFTVEQLAGDLLPEPTKAQLVATGFHRNTLINQEGGTDREQFRNETVVDRVNTTGAVWLGLTLGCAQCHTHKYDPVTHREYFELFAFFNHGTDVNAAGSTVEVFEGEIFLDDPDPALLSALEEARVGVASLERSRFQRQETWESETLAALEAAAAQTIDASSTAPPTPDAERLLALLRKANDARDDAEKRELSEAFNRADEELAAARSELASARHALGLGAPAPTMVMRDLPEPRETHVHLRGDFLSLDTETGPLLPGVPAILPALEEKEEAYDRLDLAQWLVRPDHPLTARVTVNRVWMRYFGSGIVETENDFGLQSANPTHPDLLDWLAAWFVEEAGWSMKALHRLIATSAVYRQSSRARDDLAESDPLNRLLARQARLRVEAEIVRDAALSASGLLTPAIGGPSVRPPQPEGVYAFTQRQVAWVPEESPARYRRALYTRFYRAAPYPLLTTFDSPDFQSVCTARTRSNTPLQALTLANDAALHELAQGLAARLLREVDGHDSEAARERVRLAFLVCYARQPTESERERVVAFQEGQAEAYRADPEATASMAPPTSVAELAGWDPETAEPALAASWVAVARALMNTDEFITRE